MRGLARINIYGEEMPRAENRVELSSEKDEFGYPIARIIHSYDQDAIDLWRSSLDDGLEIAKAAKPKDAWKGGGAAPGTIHLNGGTIMGTGADNSVTNGYGQTHEVANLYLAGVRSVPDRRRAAPDQHPHGGVAARRRAPGEELEHDRELRTAGPGIVGWVSVATTFNVGVIS